MTRVLFVAYYFPPVGGSGVQRTVKFVRYLDEFGYTPVVIAGPLASHGLGEPRDSTLAREVPGGVEVLRVTGPEPAPAGRWRARSERWARRRSEWSNWWIDGVVAVSRETPEPDVIVATGSPFESFDAAAELSRRLGVPWIADLRDPWALDEMRVYQTGVHRRLELGQMRRVLRTAAAVVMNTPEAAKQLVAAFPELPAAMVRSITNGYDRADFAGVLPERADGAFRITHVGSLHTTQGTEHRRVRWARRVLHGTIGEVDILARSHIYLMEAVGKLFDEDPDLARQLEIHLAGELTSDDKAAIELEIVREHGYLDHTESVLLTRTADLLFLPMHDLPPGQRARIVPGKTYEYLAAGRPILAAVPDGDARDLVAEAPNSYLCRPRDVDGMAAAIRAEFERARRGERAAPLDPEILRQYERRELTRQLAGLLDEVSRKDERSRKTEAGGG